MFILRKIKKKRKAIKKFNFGLVLKPKEVYKIRKGEFEIKKSSFFFDKKKELYIKNLLKRDIKILSKKKEISEIYNLINKNKKISLNSIFICKKFYKIEVFLIEKEKKKKNFNDIINLVY
ncbi:hypothetical protein [Candidatus Vidania fulgoroideorum]